MINRSILSTILVLFATLSFSQNNSFPFGHTTYRDLDMVLYEKDTSAVAVVLQEFGEAYIEDDNDYNLLFDYHVKMKILKQQGVEEATIIIPLYKSSGRIEKVRSIKASSFNFEGGSMRETKLDIKDVLVEKTNKNWDHQKFAIPNVRVGSVIEYQYVLESPFIFNFRTWNFQSEFPKVKSEFWSTIPANYTYNTTLKGFLELSKVDGEVLRDCFYKGLADCSRSKYVMLDVPAFKEEDFMTAKSNFLSAINYELSEIKHFDGRVEKFTKDWKSADLELKTNEKFGLQIKRGKDIVEDHIELAVLGETDSLLRAQKIFDFVKGWYTWDEVYGIFSEFGIKKAFDTRKGNVGDINLTLIAALKYAGFNVEPLILSTRSNGFPIELHPVITDFNYVIAKLNLGGKPILLDAVDDFIPFGTIPIRCLNGKGRVIGEKQSYWHELKPMVKLKKFTSYTLTLNEEGVIKGSLQNAYYGYEALDKRKEIAAFTNEKQYLQQVKDKATRYQILGSEIVNGEHSSKELIENFEIELEGEANAGYVLFSPFLDHKLKENPFKSTVRVYPVDYGAPIDQTFSISIEYPATFELAELPEKAALVLPNGGGRYLFGIQNLGNKVLISSLLNISKPLYSSEEYHYLKELYNRMIQVQNSDLMFKRKEK